MKKKTVMSLLAVMSASMMLMSAGAFAAETEGTTEAATEISTEAESESESEVEELEDGVYSAEFDTDSGMFHANEACDGKGTLTVKDGKMTFHVSLASKNILNLFVGTAEDAQKDGAELLEPTTDTVTYKDGAKEEVYGFDITVEEVGKEFDLALIGTKGKWYDHKVSIKNPEKLDEAESESESESETATEVESETK